MSNAIRAFLATVEPFKHLPATELDRIASASSEVKHIKGETIYSEGDESQGVWILKMGRLEILKYSSDGKPAVIEIVMPKGMYGMYCRIGNPDGPYQCTPVAAVDSVSICIPDKIFWPLFQRNAAFVASVCMLCSQRLSEMQELVSTSREPVQKRIVKTLFSLSKNNGATLRLTKREIAELSSTTVETTIRTLSAFEKKHWISSERGQITLKDQNCLEALLAA
jgi:CRP/FNR family transcriptional regulator